MKKILILIAGVIVVAGIILIVISLKKQSAPTHPQPPLTEGAATPQPVKLCFYGATKTNSGLSDVSLAVLNISGNQVTGKFNYLPAEKDRKIGTFSGTVGAVDKIAMARTADVIWNVSAEGMTAQEQLRIVFGEGTAQAGFGEMVQGENTIWNYKDVSKLSYGQIMTDVDCNDARLAQTQVQQPVTLTDGRQCYTYSHDATTGEPYTTSEFIDITISGNKVLGTKTGNQAGPDMTNGYTGTITGTLADNKISDAYAYTVEGSKNTEHEIYQAGLTGIDKLRYPLIDKFKAGLFPDTSKSYTIQHYSRVECKGSN
jgi:hypothetical protein